MHVTVSTPGLLAMRRDLKTIAAAGLGKDLSRGLTRAAQPLRPAISAEATATLPSSGGYGPLMAKSVRVRAQSRADRLTALISVTVHAAGRKERRDIVRVDRGELRHPVYGRSRRLRRGLRAGTAIRNPWSVTKVPPGFASRPIDRLGPAVGKAGVEVVNDLMTRLRG